MLMTREQHLECIKTWLNYEKGENIPVSCTLRDKTEELFHSCSLTEMRQIVFDSALFILSEQL